MFRAVQRYLLRRKLKRVTVALPFELARRYGDSEFYTAGQAKAAISALKIAPHVMPYALVVALAEDDAAKLDPTLTPERCAEVRSEIADAFGLTETDFTAKDLRSSRNVQRFSKGIILSDGTHLWGGAAYDGQTIAQHTDTPSHH